MKKYRDISLRGKITILVFTILIISLGLGVIFGVYSNINFFKEELSNRMHASASIIGDYIVSDIEFNYPETTITTLEKLNKYEEIKNIVVFKTDSTVFAEYAKPGYEGFKPKYSVIDSNYYCCDEFLYINHIIKSSLNKDVGIIFLRVSTELLTNRINDYIRFVAILLVAILLFSVIIGLFLSKTITKPIFSLVDVMKKISEEENYSLRVEKIGDDEIGFLYDGFNEMLKKIELSNLERDIAIEQLTKSEENFKGIFHASHDAIFLHDKDGKILSVNDTMLKMYEVSLEEVEKLTINDFSSNKNRFENIEEIWENVVENGTEGEIEWIAKKIKSKEEFFVTVNLKRIELFEKIIVMATVRDITEEYKAKKLLKESEHKLKTMFETLPVGVGIIKNRKIIETNKASAEITGYSMEEIIGSSVDLLYKNNTQFIEAGKKIYNNDFKGGIELNWVTKDGRNIFVYMNIMPLTEEVENGEMLFSFIDITSLKKAEKEIRKLNEELEERVKKRTEQLEAVNKELEAFSYSVSHDLRSPLRGIDGFSLALYEDYYDQLDNDAKDYIIRIRTATKRMAKLIDDMLKLSRSTKGELNIETFNIDEVVQSIVNGLKDEQIVSTTEFIIQSPVKAIADLVLIRSVLQNLIGNAVKFSSKKEKPIVEFGVYSKNISKQKFGFPKDVYYVRDNGVGFDMKYSDKLFGAFQRLHPKDDFEGTGIGLATVQRIINKHGGKIWAEGYVNKGATFYFTLG